MFRFQKSETNKIMLHQLNEVTDNLYIGSARSVSDESLSEAKITCIVNCSLTSPNYQYDNYKYFPILVADNEQADISRFFDAVSNIINEEQHAGGKTLVYCVAGISRSATLCIAYMMKYRNMTLRNAFRHVRSRRRIIHPNNGFFRQLIELERNLFGQTTVEMVRVENADSLDLYVPDVYYDVCKGILWFRSCKNILKKR